MLKIPLIMSFVILEIPIGKSYSNSDAVFQCSIMHILPIFHMNEHIAEAYVFHTVTCYLVSVWAPHCNNVSPGNWIVPAITPWNQLPLSLRVQNKLYKIKFWIKRRCSRVLYSENSYLHVFLKVNRGILHKFDLAVLFYLSCDISVFDLNLGVIFY